MIFHLNSSLIHKLNELEVHDQNKKIFNFNFIVVAFKIEWPEFNMYANKKQQTYKYFDEMQIILVS